MPTLDALSAAVLGTVIPSVAIGIAMVLVVLLAMRFVGPLNAATRAILLTATLGALPLIPIIYLASHMPATAPSAIIGPPTPPALTEPASTPPPVVVQASPPVVRTSIQRQFNIAIAPELPIVVLGFYLSLAGLMLLRLMISYLRLCRLRRRSERAPEAIANRMSYWLARCPTNRTVEVRMSQHARSPLAVGWLKPMIILPASLALELSLQELDDLAVHELAHIRRYDDWTNLLQRLVEGVLFFHPACHYVGRKLNLEREIACDDWVIASSANESKSYARCLAKVVELRQYQRGTLVLSSGAFFGKRQLLKRVESLLDKTRNSATRVSGLTVLAAVVILVAIITQVAHLPSVIAFTQEQRATTSIHWSDDSRDFAVNYRGEMTFSPDDRSIESISPAGFLTIDESKNWSHRRLEVRPGPDGRPEVKYFIDGREKPFDGVGRAWAASSYLLLIRETGLNAEERVGRILAAHGPGGVFQELDLIHSDGVKRQYLDELAKQAVLSTTDMQRVADSARKISSDNDKAEFLIAHQREFATPDLRTSYFRAVNSIHSDNDRRRVLSSMLATDGHSSETARLVGLSAKSMSSDNDKAEVLLSMPATSSGDSHCLLLKAASSIQSDNDKARVLHDSGYVESAQCRDEYFGVVNLIQSDSDRAGVLQNLLEKADLQADTFRDIANSAKGINSDNDKANVLTRLGARYTAAPFFAAADTIQSSNDLARVLHTVIDSKPAAPVLLAVVESASRLTGEDEKANVLLAIAKTSSDTEVRKAVQNACEKIGSDNEYRRVASALFETPASR